MGWRPLSLNSTNYSSFSNLVFQARSLALIRARFPREVGRQSLRDHQPILTSTLTSPSPSKRNKKVSPTVAIWVTSLKTTTPIRFKISSKGSVLILPVPLLLLLLHTQLLTKNRMDFYDDWCD